MTSASPAQPVGWIGTGRMGYAMVSRLLATGRQVLVYNRTRAKAEPLAAHGAVIVDSIGELARCDVVFTMVAASADLAGVTTGPGGLLCQDASPGIIVDCSTVSVEASAALRKAAAQSGTSFLAAPVSGNAKVAKAGKLSIVTSGDRAAFDSVRPMLETMARAVSYAGAGEAARIVKIAHNVLLGAVTQSLAEVTVLAESAGVSRHDFLEFINSSVLGSVFTRYKTPAFVNLDFTPTFTSVLLRKDLDLGLATARAHEVPMPLASLTHQLVQTAIGRGQGEADFAVLLREVAECAGRQLQPENVEVSDGLTSAS